MKNFYYNFFVTISFLVIFNFTFNIETCSAQWEQMSNGIGTSKSIRCLTVNGTNIFAGTLDSGIYRSTNNGTTWTKVNNGLSTSRWIVSLAVLGTNIYAGTNTGVFLSANNGETWSAVGLASLSIQAFAVSGTNIFAGTGGSGIFLSTNNGSTWSASNNGITNQNITSLGISGVDIFAGTFGGGIFTSRDNGSNWSTSNAGITNLYIKSFASSDLFLVAGTNNSGVYLSMDNGASWGYINNGLSSPYIYSLAISGTNIFAGTQMGGAFVSTNFGLNWFDKNQGFNNTPSVLSFLIVNNYVFCGTTDQSVWRRSLSEIIGVQNISTEIPSAYSLSQNYPNPFNPITNVKFSILNSGNIKLAVYDVMGREVQTLVNERLQAGTYEVKFDGSMLPSGVYFYKLKTDGFTETKNMILIK